MVMQQPPFPSRFQEIVFSMDFTSRKVRNRNPGERAFPWKTYVGGKSSIVLHTYKNPAGYPLQSSTHSADENPYGFSMGGTLFLI